MVFTVNMRPKSILFIVGLPASGKTTYAKSILGGNQLLVDDPKTIDEIKAALASVDSVIVTDPNLCLTENRNKAVELFGENEIRFVFFENDPVQCIKNSMLRESKLVENYIKYLSKRYFIPYATRVIPVYNPALDTMKIPVTVSA